MFLLLLALSLYALALYLFFYLKLFRPINVQLIKTRKCRLVYTKYQGNYHKMTPTFSQMKQDFSRYFLKQDNSTLLFGIYYDDPSILVDSNQARAVLGAIVDNKFDFNHFKKFNGNALAYETVQVEQDLEGFGAKFPFFNMLNILYAVIFGYPAIKKKCDLNQVNFSLEVYDSVKNELLISFPVGPSAECLKDLSGIVCPKYKDE